MTTMTRVSGSFERRDGYVILHFDGVTLTGYTVGDTHVEALRQALTIARWAIATRRWCGGAA